MQLGRVSTGIALGLGVAGVTYWGPFWLFSSLVALVLALGGREWAHLSGGNGLHMISVLLLLYLLGIHLDYNWPWIVLGVFWWVWIMVGIPVFRGKDSFQGQVYWLGFAALLPFAILAVQTQAASPELALWCIAMVVAADTGAYFAGKALGREPLAPTISPKKTWAGFYGGVIGSGAVGLLGASIILGGPCCFGLAVGMGVGLLATMGDLGESMLKRSVGVKDSGHLLPGHGGILDRIDGYTAAVPFFFVIMMLAEWL